MLFTEKIKLNYLNIQDVYWRLHVQSTTFKKLDDWSKEFKYLIKKYNSKKILSENHLRELTIKYLFYALFNKRPNFKNIHFYLSEIRLFIPAFVRIFTTKKFFKSIYFLARVKRPN